MRDHADDLRPADLRPESRGHIVPEPGHGESSEAVDATCHALDVALLSELDETDLVQARCPRLGRGEVAALVFGDSVEDGVPRRQWMGRSKPTYPGRPRTDATIRRLVDQRHNSAAVSKLRRTARISRSSDMSWPPLDDCN
jgi:hypothetical protein